MKLGSKALNLLALAVCVISLGLLARLSYARLTAQGASDADIWCVGPSGAEVCADYSGNFLPTTDNDTTLGATALRWASIWGYDLTLTDDLSVGDDLTVTGDATVDGDITLGSATGDLLDINAGKITFNGTSAGLNIGTDTSGPYLLFLKGDTNRIGVLNAAPSVALDVTGAVTASGALIINGNTTLGDNTSDSVTATGAFTKTQPDTETLGAGGTITANGCGGIKRLKVTDDRTTSTTNTFTAPAAGNAGCIMVVVNEGGGAITLDNNALFASFGAADVVMGTNDVVSVGSTGSTWVQIGSMSNN